jgi:DNA-binding XRE family transcriptional regulator
MSSCTADFSDTASIRLVQPERSFFVVPAADSDSSPDKPRARARQLGSKSFSEFLKEHPVTREEEDGALKAVDEVLGREVQKGSISHLTARRVLAGMTQKQLAQVLGVPQSQISRWERPQNFEQISLANLKRLAAALDITVCRLVDV